MNSKNHYKGFKEGMNDFGHNLSGIVNAVLLSVVYIAGVGPTSILAKLSGKRFLEKNKQIGIINSK